MEILIILGIPLLVWAVIMLFSLREPETRAEPSSKVAAPFSTSTAVEDAPRFSRDYTGRLWVEKKRKGFFVRLRRRNMRPPGEPEE